ncbi:MAG: lactonase family protein [Candidatus Sulfotelmatobacter sp.]
MLSPRASVLPICAISLILLLGACGGSGGGSFQQNPPPPQPEEFLYGSDLADVVVTEKLDSSTGALSTGTSVPGGNGAMIAANPAGTFLYTSDASSNSVDGFAIGSSGVLTAISGSPFSAPGSGGVSGLAIDPTGKFLYGSVESGSGAVAGFSIGADGSLNAIRGSPFTAGTSPAQIVTHPGGKFLYVGDAAGGILAFSISSSGGLTLTSDFPFFSGDPPSLAITPDGKFLYIADFDGIVNGYSIDSTTGSLTELTNSPFSNATGTGDVSTQILVEPTGKFLYTYNTIGNPNTISAFSIDSGTGNLTAVAGSPFAASQSVYFAASLATDPDGKFLYASCSSGSCGVLGFNIDANTGALSPITGSPFNSFFTIGRMAVVSVQ